MSDVPTFHSQRLSLSLSSLTDAADKINTKTRQAVAVCWSDPSVAKCLRAGRVTGNERPC